MKTRRVSQFLISLIDVLSIFGIFGMFLGILNRVVVKQNTGQGGDLCFASLGGQTAKATHMLLRKTKLSVCCENGLFFMHCSLKLMY